MIVLMRHGEPATSPAGNLSNGGGRVLLGRTDAPLTEHGRAQARAWGRRLADSPILTIKASPLARAWETAQLAATGLRAQPTADARLQEVDLGRWDGLPKDEVIRRWPEEWRRRGEDLAQTPALEGESFAETQARAVPVLEELRDYASGESHALVVAHAGVIRCLLCHVLEMPLERLFQLEVALCSLHCVDVSRDSWRLLHHNILPFNNPFPESCAVPRSS